MTDKIPEISRDSIHVAENLKELKDHGDFEYPVGVYEINMKNMYMETVRWHWHDELELIFIHEGCGEFHVSDDSYILSKGQGLCRSLFFRCFPSILSAPLQSYQTVLYLSASCYQ